MDSLHEGIPPRTVGAPLSDARATVVAVHGRGATAGSILSLADELPTDDVAYVAPQAAGNTWYPNSFLAPIDSNEPELSSALRVIDRAVADAEDEGVAADRVVFVGFSQGACLASEYVARNAREYGGLAAFSGGLIGPQGTPRDYDGSLDGTPVFIGCSDRDPHIPLERVHETQAVFEDLDADVTERIYEGMGHTINADELDHLRDLVSQLVSE
ncbi:MAG: alpha/beta hydrolase [Halobacteriota archaeon]